jgi:thiamine-phosphate pyrophosphorylase
LMLVTDRTLAPAGTLPSLIERAIDGGVDAVQLREKDLPERELIALGRELRDVTRGRALLLVNGTIEQAAACDADGVHVGEGGYLTPPAPLPSQGRGEFSSTEGASISVGRGMSIAPPPSHERTPPSLRGKGAGGLGRLIFSRAAHSIEAARRAEAEGVDFVVIGTIFPSRSHPGGTTGGPGLVARVSATVRVPVIAIGGITEENAGAVIDAGAAGVAVISAILAAEDPRAAAAALRDAIDAAVPRPVGEQA